MKLKIIALSVTFIFLIGPLGNNAVSKSTPEGYMNPWQVDPDDHTWGGEQRMSDHDNYSDSDGFFQTGILPLDFFFNIFLVRHLSIFDLQTGQNVTQERFIQPRQQVNEDSGNHAVSDSKDN